MSASRLASLLFAATSLVAGSRSALAQQEVAATRPAARPNVIIILADDLGYSDLGCFGGDVHTPNLDALAREGVRFTDFYNDARCCPTRASILTGLYPHQAGIGGMNERTALPAYSGALKPTTPTVAEVLKTAGYKTVAFGKWHVSNTLERPEHMSDLNRKTFPDVFSPDRAVSDPPRLRRITGATSGALSITTTRSRSSTVKRPSKSCLPTSTSPMPSTNTRPTTYSGKRVRTSHFLCISPITRPTGR